MIDKEKIITFVLGGLKVLGWDPEYTSVLRARNEKLISDKVFRIVRVAIYEAPDLWEKKVNEVYGKAEEKNYQPDEEKPKRRGRPKKEAK